MATAPTVSRKLILTLAGGMLLSGTLTSISMKWQDMQCVGNCSDPDSSKHKTYEQPILQSECMMLGEMLCLLAATVLTARQNRFSETIGAPIHPDAPPILDADAVDGDKPLTWSTRLLFAGPATFDILGTTSMNAALLWVDVSIYQMLKGALTLWVAFFSIIFLGRRLARAQWAAVIVVALGVTVVGYSSITHVKTLVENASSHPVLGVFIILLAQVFPYFLPPSSLPTFKANYPSPTVASLFVIEEKIMESYSIEPLTAVGWEGVFGFIIIAISMVVLHLLFGRTPAGQGGFFDAPNAFKELFSGPRIWGPAIVFTISVAFTNGFGLAVTKNVSATARSTIDTCRTCSIWIVSLALGWESLKLLQLVGFALLVYGTFIFNGIITWPTWTGLHDETILADKHPHVRSRSRGGSVGSRSGRRTGDEREPLLAES